MKAYKRYFTLIETIMGMSFLSVLVITALSYTNLFIYNHEKSLSYHKQLLQLEYLYQRLWILFDKTVIEKDMQKPIFPFLYADTQNIVWLTTLSQDEHIYERTFVHLQLEQGKLFINYWPYGELPDSHNRQTEILLEGIKSYSTQFHIQQSSGVFQTFNEWDYTITQLFPIWVEIAFQLIDPLATDVVSYSFIFNIGKDPIIVPIKSA
ncbi:MAG: hypothetical protein K0S74_1683 [Chlamydiales bacterium]|jgi:hypothetical protein|nr:hypothetical protein [Chlamydiales bacterium]